MRLNEALKIKTDKRILAEKQADVRRAELHARFARIAEIDAEIRELPLRALSGMGIESARAETESLVAEREQILRAAGYDPDYDTPAFECTDCNDGGYVGLKLCKCVKKLMAQDNYAKSSLAQGLLDKTFQNFSMSYYNDANGEKAKMQAILNGCKKYSDSFPNDNSAGLLFIGGTGLGKTHLSAAIANELVKKGFSVVYESAQQIVETCDAVRYNRLDIAERKKYENCSLLIIDDLGAEYISPYGVSSMTSLIDLRIVNGRATVISTNLTPNAIRKTYGERLLSRLLGEFRVLQFVGKDVRLQRIQG